MMLYAIVPWANGLADFFQVFNAHDVGSVNRSIHFCHSPLQSSPQFLIQPPEDLPFSSNL